MARCKRTVQAILIFTLLAGLTGCAKLFNAAPAQPGAKPPAPLQASVSQAFFVGGTLHIKVKLQALASVPTESVVVGVLGLREGQVVERKYERLLDVLKEPTFVRGNSALVPFELTA